jgi:hypothetical protein
LKVAKTRGRPPFDFRVIGADLAKIANPDDAPGKWSIGYLELTRSRLSYPGASIVVRPPYAFLFGVIVRAHSRQAIILTRVALDHLDKPAQSLEYLAAGGKWKPAPIRSDALDVIAEGWADFSVRYHPDVARWIEVQQQYGFGSHQIGIRSAPALEGPWSAFQPLFEEPEMISKRNRRKRMFCYAAKEHPSFEMTPGTLIVTYACSSLRLHTLARDMSIYRPVVAQIPLKMLP